MAPRRKKIIDVASAIMLLSLVLLDIMLWKNTFLDFMAIARDNVSRDLAVRTYALPVARGASSTLLMLSNDVTVLVNAGSDDSIVDDLQKVLPSGAPSYIDLAIISSPKVVDYEGYEYLLAHYRVGAFLYNGRADGAHSAEWMEIINTIAAKHIPLITVGAGDSICYAGVEIDIIAPDATSVHSPSASDTAIIERASTSRR